MPKRVKSYNEWLGKRLTDPLEAERFLRMAMADSPARFLKAVRKVAEAKRMATVAEEVGVSRESLYKSLSEAGNPAYRTIECVLDVLGMTLDVRLKSEAPTASHLCGTMKQQRVRAKSGRRSRLKSSKTPVMASNCMRVAGLTWGSPLSQAALPDLKLLMKIPRKMQPQAACGD